MYEHQGHAVSFCKGPLMVNRFLVTCPINRYSYALSGVKQPLRPYYCSLQPKAALAAQKVINSLVAEGTLPNSPAVQRAWRSPVYVRSDIAQGKGMASSSADISVAAMATALAYGRALTLEELKEISLSIEPSDASFIPG